MEFDFTQSQPVQSMRTTKTQTIMLESLSSGIPAMPVEVVGFYKLQCMLSFHHNGHSSGVNLSVDYDGFPASFDVYWTGEVSEQHIRAFAEKTRLVDHAACAIGLLLVRELTAYTAVEQSSIGTTIDYYLGFRGSEDDLIFNHAARLEVSGILRESKDNSVGARTKSKTDRLVSEGDLPDFVIVVEFSKPWSKLTSA